MTHSRSDRINHDKVSSTNRAVKRFARAYRRNRIEQLRVEDELYGLTPLDTYVHLHHARMVKQLPSILIEMDTNSISEQAIVAMEASDAKG